MTDKPSVSSGEGWRDNLRSDLLNESGVVETERVKNLLREAAPQGVGKLSPEPLPNQCMEPFPIEWRQGRYFCILDKGHDGMHASKLLELKWPAEDSSRELPMEGRYLRESEPKQMHSNPKGVEGVGQTARELAAVEYWKAEAVYWQARYGKTWAETLTLRQVLLQIRELSTNCSSEVERARRMYQIWKLAE